MSAASILVIFAARARAAPEDADVVPPSSGAASSRPANMADANARSGADLDKARRGPLAPGGLRLTVPLLSMRF